MGRWQVRCVQIEREIRRGDRQALRSRLTRRWYRRARPVIKPVAVCVLVIGQSLAALFLAPMLIGLVALFTDKPPGWLGWCFISIPTGLAWMAVLTYLSACRDFIRARIFDPHLLLMTLGLVLSLPLCGSMFGRIAAGDWPPSDPIAGSPAIPKNGSAPQRAAPAPP